MNQEMMQVNEYFDSNVKSLALENARMAGLPQIVMDAGEYEFGTTTIEYMTVISGSARDIFLVELLEEL